MKTSELTGAALDWAVAKCEEGIWDKPIAHGFIYRPSSAWSQGGPIIEREGITVSDGSPVTGLEWMACDRGSTHIQHGPTYLIAAMRCYVASKLGDEVNVPEELR
jgi:hypothetical protein